LQSYAPDDGHSFVRNMLSWSWRSITLLFVASSWFWFYWIAYIEDARSNTNKKKQIILCHQLCVVYMCVCVLVPHIWYWFTCTHTLWCECCTIRLDHIAFNQTACVGIPPPPVKFGSCVLQV
jgi:hypothetical protein